MFYWPGNLVFIASSVTIRLQGVHVPTADGSELIGDMVDVDTQDMVTSKTPPSAASSSNPLSGGCI